LNAPFGTGRIASGTGIIPAALAGPGGRGADALSVMLVINHHVNEFHFAGAASGGVAAPTALANVAARALLDRMLLSNAMTAARVHRADAPERAYYEQGLDEASVEALGADAGAVEALGRVNAVHCPNGIPPNPENCAALSDPRGAGLGQMSDEG
jgi:gamma-glutamyltranspeptidase/glutathione hydrolase